MTFTISPSPPPHPVEARGPVDLGGMTMREVDFSLWLCAFIELSPETSEPTVVHSPCTRFFPRVIRISRTTCPRGTTLPPSETCTQEAQETGAFVCALLTGNRGPQDGARSL